MFLGNVEKYSFIAVLFALLFDVRAVRSRELGVLALPGMCWGISPPPRGVDFLEGNAYIAPISRSLLRSGVLVVKRQMSDAAGQTDL